MQLSEFSVRRPITLIMMVLSVLVLGVISLKRLPLEQLPSISSSSISVSVSYPSSSPEEVERLISVPLEAALGTLNNTEEISSSSSRTGANVRVEFKSGTDMDLATMEVRDRVDQARADLPNDVDRIQLRRWQSTDRPILYASIAWRGEGDRLPHLVEKVIEPRLLRIEGAANVTVDGLEERQLIVELDQERLEAHNITLPYLTNLVRANNVNVSLGRVLDGGDRFLVRALGEFQQLEDIGRLPLGRSGLHLEDVGRVSYDYPEKKDYRRLNGADAVTVQLYKTSTANVVDVSQAANQALDQIEAEYDGLLDIEVVRDQAESVLREVGSLVDAAVLGGILAIAIIFLFLSDIRSTLVIGATIPIAVLSVFIGMYAARELFGSQITLNMVSMMGLMLAVGMLVDPAVVTLESIFRQRSEEGLGARLAALKGSREVGMAVLASGLTTMCVFIPFFFMSSGRMSQWMGDAGLTICLAIGVSMIVSLTFIPLASSRLFRDGLRRFDPLLKTLVVLALVGLAGWQLADAGWDGFSLWLGTWSQQVGASITAMAWTQVFGFVAFFLAAALLVRRFRRHGMRQTYAGMLNWTLDHRGVVLLVTVALLGSGIYLFQQLEQQGTPWTPERRADISVQMERSYSLDEVRQFFGELEGLVLAQKDQFDIETVSTEFAGRGGTLTARLVDADDGKLSTMEATNAIKAVLPERPGVTYKVGRTRSWSGPQLGVEVQLSGINADVLAVLADEVKAQLAQLPGVQDVDISLEDGDEEIRVQVDREQALTYGLSPRQVAGSIATALGSRRTTTFKATDAEIDVVMQLEEADRVDLEQLKTHSFEGQQGNRIQLATLADFRLQQGPQDLQRENRQLTVTVFANTESRRQAGQLTGPIQTMMAGIALPAGYSWSLGRAARWMQQDTAGTNVALLFAVLLIYLIMASLFESLIHPFTIILAIPFSLIGVVLGHYALDIALDFNGILGLLILFGIVVNNGIVLIDHINHYRREGMDRRQAILIGGQHRMRPILMTAVTTILNLMPLVLPMIYGTAEGFAKRWGPTGFVVVCGLATSTVLTLVLAPTLYSLLDDLALWMRRVVHEARTKALA